MEEVLEAMRRGGHGDHTRPPRPGGGLSRAWFIKIRDAFSKSDADRSGSLDFRELISILEILAIPVNKETLETLYRKHDRNRDGKLTFDEFLSYFQDEPQCVPARPFQQPGVDVGGKFVDTSFPCDDKALFFSKTSREQTAAEQFKRSHHRIGWKRVSDICPGGKLFNNIHPNDIMQGELGNCWLLAGLAALAEFPVAIMNLFEQKEASQDGKYTCRIYNAPMKKWEAVVVDDFIPVDPATSNPIFSKPRDNEMWVLILEKAIAKWMGSYIMTEGAYCMLPYLLLTDVGQCKAFTKTPGGYQIQLSTIQSPHDRSTISLRNGGTSTSDLIWEELKQADQQNYAMGAWTFRKVDATGHGASGEAIGGDGIVSGHAYSLIVVTTFTADGHRFDLVQLRNPWGRHEWNGAFSDHWKGWRQFPELKEKLQIGSAQMDGMFWMPRKDFFDCFTDVGISPKNMQMPRLGEIELATASCGKGFMGSTGKKSCNAMAVRGLPQATTPFDKDRFLNDNGIKPADRAQRAETTKETNCCFAVCNADCRSLWRRASR